MSMDFSHKSRLQTITLKMRGFVPGIFCLAKLPNSGTNVRIHVERVIGLLRHKYSVVQITLPVDYLLCLDKERNRCCLMVDRLIRVCCALTNLCPSVIPIIIVYMYVFWIQL